MFNFKQWRFKLFLATKTLPYTEDYLRQIYKIYINHDKIIHYRDGCPVFSLSTPAVFSKPGANMLARSVFSNIQNRNLPNLMSFAVNDVCNANCKHCSFFTEVDDKTRKPLDLKEGQKLIADAQKLGVTVINFVGGEPLLRKDLPQLIQSVDKNLSTTVMFTNGYLLRERASELKKNGLDSIYVSLDSVSSTIHDKKRGKEGIFKRAILGIKESLRLGFSVGISMTLTEKEFRDGALEKMIELGKKLGVHEVVVFDMIPTGKMRNCQALVDNNNWIEELISSVEKYNIDQSYPGILVYAYSTSYQSTGCSGGTSYFYVSPYGDISPCDFNHRCFGNILEKPLYRIWETLTNNPQYNQATWGGCKMKSSKFRKENKN